MGHIYILEITKKKKKTFPKRPGATFDLDRPCEAPRRIACVGLVRPATPSLFTHGQKVLD